MDPVHKGSITRHLLSVRVSALRSNQPGAGVALGDALGAMPGAASANDRTNRQRLVDEALVIQKEHGFDVASVFLLSHQFRLSDIPNLLNKQSKVISVKAASNPARRLRAAFFVDSPMTSE